jgi:uncharacterized membrane protein
MMEHPVYVVLLFALIGALFVALGIPLQQGAVPPNWWYGFRTRKTLSNKEIWYAINRVTGIDMIRTGVVIVGASLIVLALRNRLSAELVILVLVAVMLIMVAYMAVHGFSLLRRM